MFPGRHDQKEDEGRLNAHSQKVVSRYRLRYPVAMLQVIGAGFGRTGTHSLGLALEKLGLGPCYNILEMSKNPDHTEIWNRAMNGKPVDWDSLFSSYKSAVEWPTVAFLPELVQHFSDATVILTVRAPESWYESANATIFDGLELSAQNPDPDKRRRSGLQRRLILERTFAGKYRDKAHTIQVYQQHNQNVVETVSPERLLQFDVRSGWEPLCKFLDRPIPDEPFPRVNEGIAFQASTPDWAKKIKEEREKSRT